MPSLPARSWTEIDLSALAHNVRAIRSLIPRRCEVIGIVKADAYGHGMVPIARRLAREGVRTFAVANIGEAALLSSSLPQASILILGPLLPEEVNNAVRHPQWILTLSSERERKVLEKAAARARSKVRVHVKLDTGMGRLGAFADDLFDLMKRIQVSKHLQIAGLLSHLASADIDIASAKLQLKRLRDFRSRAIQEGIPVPFIHLQNSAGTLRLPVPDWIDAIRPGLSIYGLGNPREGWNQRLSARKLRPILAWKTRVALVRDVPAGTTISYAGTFQTKHHTRVAVLAAGYADGVFRKLSNRGEVLLRGRRCRILGRVTMDMIMVDATRVPKVRWGDPVVLLGRDGRDEITAHEFASWAETSPYEVLCSIDQRVARRYLK